MKKIAVIFFSLIILAMLSAAAGGCNVIGGASSAPTPTRTPGAVRSSATTISEAAVVPARYANLSFSAVGMISEVLVGEGMTVKAGNMIARLKGSERIQASISAAEVEQLSAEQALDTLTRNADLAKAQANQRLAYADKALDKAKKDREYRKYVRGSQAQIEAAESDYVLALDELKKTEDMFANISVMDDVNRAWALAQISKARTRRDKALENWNYLKAMPNQFEVGIAEADLVKAQAEYDAARRDYDRVKAGPDPEQVALLKSRIKNAQSQITSAKAALADLELTAPFNGTLVTNNLKVGEVIGAATLPSVVLAELATMQIETTDLTELNVINVKVGMPVNITFDALPGVTMTGKVNRIKTLGVNKQGDITYTVIIDLDKQDEKLRWNMTASVTFQK